MLRIQKFVNEDEAVAIGLSISEWWFVGGGLWTAVGNGIKNVF